MVSILKMPFFLGPWPLPPRRMPRSTHREELQRVVRRSSDRKDAMPGLRHGKRAVLRYKFSRFCWICWWCFPDFSGWWVFRRFAMTFLRLMSFLSFLHDCSVIASWFLGVHHIRTIWIKLCCTNGCCFLLHISKHMNYIGVYLSVFSDVESLTIPIISKILHIDISIGII